jgi:hypothetical protein
LDRVGDGKGFPVRRQAYDAFRIQKKRPQKQEAISFGLSQV